MPDLNRVKFYVWLPDNNMEAQTYGHVALRTFGPNGIYVSLWPKRSSKREQLFFGAKPLWVRRFSNPPEDEFKTLEKMKHSVGVMGEPVIIELYHLDVDKLHQAYKALMEVKQARFRLWSSGRFFTPQFMNCTGIVQHLLTAADKTGELKQYFKTSGMLTPVDMLELLRVLKQREAIQGQHESARFSKVLDAYNVMQTQRTR